MVLSFCLPCCLSFFTILSFSPVAVVLWIRLPFAANGLGYHGDSNYDIRGLFACNKVVNNPGSARKGKGTKALTKDVLRKIRR